MVKKRISQGTHLITRPSITNDQSIHSIDKEITAEKLKSNRHNNNLLC